MGFRWGDVPVNTLEVESTWTAPQLRSILAQPHPQRSTGEPATQCHCLAVPEKTENVTSPGQIDIHFESMVSLGLPVAFPLP